MILHNFELNADYNVAVQYDITGIDLELYHRKDVYWLRSAGIACYDPNTKYFSVYINIGKHSCGWCLV